MAKVTFCWLSGYGTLGRKLVDGATSIRMFNEEFAVKAADETLGGFSARDGQSELVEWIARFSNQPEVALVRGETQSSRFGPMHSDDTENNVSQLDAEDYLTNKDMPGTHQTRSTSFIPAYADTEYLQREEFRPSRF